MLKVIFSGLWTSIQDLGRDGYRHFGVPLTGVMDTRSARLANLLLNNPADAALLETTMIGPELEFSLPTRVALTGADMSAKLNGHMCAMNKVIEIAAGDRLSFGRLQYGLRTYLAIEQGFQTPLVMESRSFYNNITQQTKVETGDELAYFKRNSVSQKSHGKPSHAAVKIDRQHFNTKTLHVYCGPEFECLTTEQQQQLLQSEFTVSPKNNRMAYQLEELLENSLEPILTSAVLPGTIQLTPSGKLLILMRDCQTTGGYPRVLQLSEQALNQLAQKRQGSKLSFSV